MGFFHKAYDRVRMRGEEFNGVREVDQPSGAALFLRGEALERIGLLDERYFLFFEEVDLCRRIKDAGYSIYLLPEARITHHGGGSRRQNRALTLRTGAESMLRYFRKHEGVVRSSLFEVAFRPLFALGVLTDAARAAANVGRGRLLGRDAKRIEEREDVFRSYLSFVRNDLYPFLLQLWE